MQLPAHIKLARLKREKIALQRRIDTGGRKRHRDQRCHAEHQRRLADDFFGTPTFIKDGVVHEAIPAKLSRMILDGSKLSQTIPDGSKLFPRLLHEVQDPETGQKEFQKGPDTGIRYLKDWVICNRISSITF